MLRSPRRLPTRNERPPLRFLAGSPHQRRDDEPLAVSGMMATGQARRKPKKHTKESSRPPTGRTFWTRSCCAPAVLTAPSSLSRPNATTPCPGPEEHIGFPICGMEQSRSAQKPARSPMNCRRPMLAPRRSPSPQTSKTSLPSPPDRQQKMPGTSSFPGQQHSGPSARHGLPALSRACCPDAHPVSPGDHDVAASMRQNGCKCSRVPLSPMSAQD